MLVLKCVPLGLATFLVIQLATSGVGLVIISKGTIPVGKLSTVSYYYELTGK